ncbi:hypothetical protein [Helicobacter valdiviensis]|uniref:hypothetical protein n=1 Tax=Helicobacter valdiviensis TaxID=1458358 RepID=UPI0015EB63E5|nr:hypothetical protein [Helicobacter valdiviensis]
MYEITLFSSGAIIGATIMFFVYANNNKRFSKYAQEIDKKLEEIRKEKNND